jgi:hypothetical protein
MNSVSFFAAALILVGLAVCAPIPAEFRPVKVRNPILSTKDIDNMKIAALFKPGTNFGIPARVPAIVGACGEGQQ